MTTFAPNLSSLSITLTLQSIDSDPLEAEKPKNGNCVQAVIKRNQLLTVQEYEENIGISCTAKKFKQKQVKKKHEDNSINVI